MKKSLLALAVLASATAANAASSVTLYGTVDAGYEKVSGASLTQGRLSALGNENESRFGVKGQEDLGNGLAATFQLEGRFDASTGSYASTDSFFSRESTVGLKGSFGHLRLGRSKSALERGLGDFNPGNRLATVPDPYSFRMMTRHSNAAFYDYDMGGLNVGADVTTKGGASGNTNEGLAGQKVAYGAHASYTSAQFALGAAYQKDATNLYGYGLGGSYTFKPVTIGATFVAGKFVDNAGVVNKTRDWSTYVSADVTANDSVYVKYMSKREKAFGVIGMKKDQWAIGASHSLSKRTSVYADVIRIRDRLAQTKSTGFDIAMRHSF